jgi:hypothetical protein
VVIQGEQGTIKHMCYRHKGVASTNSIYSFPSTCAELNTLDVIGAQVYQFSELNTLLVHSISAAHILCSLLIPSGL